MGIESAASNPFVILFAEDDEGHATLVQRNLRRSGITNPVVHAKDGQAALDYVRNVRFREARPEEHLLVVLDINMPRVDGIEVLRQLKADPVTAGIPVIMLTTTDNPHEIERCYQLGCSVYVTKPVGYEAFVEAVKRLGLFLQIVEVPKRQN